MGVVTGYPTGPGSSVGWVAVGAASLQAALADASDASYVTDATTGSATYGHRLWRLPITGLTIPAGAAIKRITPKIRAQQASGNVPVRFRAVAARPDGTLVFASPLTSITPSFAIGPYFGAAGGPWIAAPAGEPTYGPTWLAGNLLAELTVPLNAFGGGPAAPDDHRIYQFSVEVEYDEQPAVTGLAFNPVDAPTRTSRPTITWSYDDPEGGPQQAFRVVVWREADAADANCPGAARTTFTATDGSTRTAAASSGTTADPSVQSAAESWAPTVDLPNGPYRWFVQAADKVLDTTRWSTLDGELVGTQAVTPPPAPQIAVGPLWDHEKYRSWLVVSSDNNMLETDTAELEASIGAWVVVTNGSRAISTDWSSSGTHSLKITAAAAGTVTVVASPAGGYLLDDAQEITAAVVTRAAAVERTCSVNVYFYREDGTFLSNPGAYGLSRPDANSTVTLTVPAPAGAHHCVLAYAVAGAGAGEVHYMDQPRLRPGSNGAWQRGGYTTGQTLTVERSIDGGPWTPVTGYQDTEFGNAVGQMRVVYDVAVPHRVLIRYRARSTHLVDGLTRTSDWSTASAEVPTNVDVWLLRDPVDVDADPLRAGLTGDLQWTQRVRTGVFEVLADPAALATPTMPRFVNGGVSGRVTPVTGQLISEADKVELERLHRSGQVLLLQSDMPGQAWWVRFAGDDALQVTLQRSTARRDPDTRPYLYAATLYESAGPNGEGPIG